MQDEMKSIKSLHDNNTWELVPLPKDRKAIPNKCVYKIELRGTGER